MTFLTFETSKLVYSSVYGCSHQLITEPLDVDSYIAGFILEERSPYVPCTFVVKLCVSEDQVMGGGGDISLALGSCQSHANIKVLAI